MEIRVRKKKTIMKQLMFIAHALLAVACEKPILDSEENVASSSAASANVILHMTQFEQTAFTRAATDITELCSRLNIAIFDADGTKVKTVAQKEGDASFGTVALTLAAGSYRLVVIAHNCDGSATITSEEKVTFPNNKVTDTFYYMADITADKDATQELLLHRIVAMVRFVLKDAIPASVTRMKFYYTGGSSTLDGNTGLGCVNSKQTEYRDVQSHDAGARFEVYTMPHDKSGVLKMNVQALDAADNVVQEQVFDEVPVTTNAITEYTGDFFGSKAEEGGGSSGASSFTLMVDDEWSGTTNYSF